MTIPFPENWPASDKAIACMRITEAQWSLPGSVKESCVLCAAEVWAAPSTAEQGHKPGWHIICNCCFDTIAQQSPVTVAGIVTPANPHPWRTN